MGGGKLSSSRSSPGSLRQPGKPPHAGPRPAELPGSFCRLRAAHMGSPLCPTVPVIHRATLGLACVSCRIQLNFQDGTDNAEFYPGTLESRESQRNPPHTRLCSRKARCDCSPRPSFPIRVRYAPCFPRTEQTQTLPIPILCLINDEVN